jgi:hypothetical protein
VVKHSFIYDPINFILLVVKYPAASHTQFLFTITDVYGSTYAAAYNRSWQEDNCTLETTLFRWRKLEGYYKSFMEDGNTSNLEGERIVDDQQASSRNFGDDQSGSRSGFNRMQGNIFFQFSKLFNKKSYGITHIRPLRCILQRTSPQ